MEAGKAGIAEAGCQSLDVAIRPVTTWQEEAPEQVGTVPAPGHQTHLLHQGQQCGRFVVGVPAPFPRHVAPQAVRVVAEPALVGRSAEPRRVDGPVQPREAELGVVRVQDRGLDRAIEDETKHPAFDELKLRQLKRQKLKLKEEMESLRRGMN